MYIEPLTLFILGEFLVVYIIINVFLFYKSRLYNVLVAILKEMRFEKHRRQQQKKKEIEDLRSTNKQLLEKVETVASSAKSAGKTIPEQLEDRIETLAQANPRAQSLDSSMDYDESTQWLRMRILELEKELLSGNIDEGKWQEMATEAINRLTEATNSSEEETANKKQNAEEERYTGQLEKDLEVSNRQLEEAKIRINHLESELEELKAIDTPSENPMEAPAAGRYADELYRLKCDNFDLHEAINKLKLQLASGEDLTTEDLNDLMENQMSNMEQYIKSADISIGLYEKELQAAQAEITKLHEQLTKAMNPPKPLQENKQALENLSTNNSEQSDALNTLKATMLEIQNGANVETHIEALEAEIQRLERLFKESEQCIVLMESELETSHEEVESLQSKLEIQAAKLLQSKMGGLNEAQQGQKEGIGNIKNIMDQLRDGGDEAELTAQHSSEVEKLEGFLKESETIIQQLEAEIDELTEKADAAEAELASEEEARQSIDSKENLLEMEELLQQFISDTQSLLTNINQLEDENIKLKQQIKR
ncbi:hypothetical protein QWZ13_12755 [Reinekea marina]|uniref:Chromosome segregation ATPase n=1 Tax=Reinekea marina TaxID=1310421 RepID=A0ABV7WUV8_9GAMM|nr:hypothetical protein [Reinekea marina]MDN3649783.1 hypothetical protein [Reinekea marina]